VLVEGIIANYRAATAVSRLMIQTRPLRSSKCIGSRGIGLRSADQLSEQRVELIEKNVCSVESALTEGRDAMQQSTDTSKERMVIL
jgi:hypothetical protein